MPPRPPAEKELFDAWFDQLLLQHHVDVQRLWKRTPQFPLPFIGAQPLAVDAFVGITTTTTTTTTTCEPQFLRPENDQLIDAWTDQGGGTTNLYDTVNESVADDSDYIKTATNNARVVFDVTAASDPGIHTDHFLRARYWKASGATTVIRLTIYAGLTLIVQKEISDTGDAAWHDFEYELSESEAGNISAYGNIEVWVEAVSVDDEVRVSWLEMEIPC